MVSSAKSSLFYGSSLHTSDYNEQQIGPDGVQPSTTILGPPTASSSGGSGYKQQATSKGKVHQRCDLEDTVSIPSIYGGGELPFFGLQYGIAAVCPEIRSTDQTSDVSGKRPIRCLICMEDFSGTVSPPSRISLACCHEPSVCSDCVAKGIKSDLESKIWNQIRCPECKNLLIYEDIERLADPETFARYEVLSTRSAVGKDDNETATEARRLQAKVDKLPAREWRGQDLLAEALRRKAEEQRREAEEQRREAEEEEQRRKAEEQRRKAEEERDAARAEQVAEAAKKKDKQERARRREDIVRRQKEELLSLDTIRATTKLCPGCRWPIEKNDGCAHMTCIKCQSEFCWSCLKDYDAIRRHDNSWHGKNCEFHTDNLP